MTEGTPDDGAGGGEARVRTAVHDDHVLVITMVRHAKRNAIDGAMTLALDAALNRLEDEADLCTPLRASEGNELLKEAILEGIGRKPKGHDFVIDRRHDQPAVSRHMSVTGG